MPAAETVPGSRFFGGKTGAHAQVREILAGKVSASLLQTRKMYRISLYRHYGRFLDAP